MGQAQQISRLDWLQVQMFQLLYKLRLDQWGPDMAFASSIADTGDDCMREAIVKRPELVERWLKEYNER